MKLARLPARSLVHFWRSSLATLAGMAVGAAVLTGALVVGDSIRHSLARMTRERLGGIDHALVLGRLTRGGLAGDLAAAPEIANNFTRIEPALALRAAVENPATGVVARGVNTTGITENFWSFDDAGVPAPSLDARGVAINAALARELGLAKGDDAILRFDRPAAIPAEAVFGRKSERIESMRLVVSDIIPDRGLGRFSLTAGQQTPFNAFLPIEALQRKLRHPGGINAVFAGERKGLKPGEGQAALEAALAKVAAPEDLGLRVRVNADPAYVAIEGLDMTLDGAEVKAVEAAAASFGARAEGVFAYLANALRAKGNDAPYSLVAALPGGQFADDAWGRMRLADGSPAPALKPGEAFINSWLAEDLAATVGESLRMDYYLEGAAGALEQTTSEPLIIRGVLAMEGAAADAGLTPEYPGIQDAKRIRDWNPPFPVDLSRVRDKDEDYWKAHKSTPKAFITLADGERLWASRFGKMTSMRVLPPAGMTLEKAEEEMTNGLRARIAPKEAGLVFQPVKARGLDASGGATDFSGLFIGFSFFIIAAALTLARLFFALGVERRSREIGAMMAMGFPDRAVRGIFLREGLALAAVGSALGAALGVGYAKLMLYGLGTWWSDAIGVNTLWLDVRPATLAAGFAGGALTALGSVWLALRPILKTPPARLLAGGAGADGAPATSRDASLQQAGRVNLAIGVGGVALALTAAAAGTFADAGARSGLFFSGGAAGLVGALALVGRAMRHPIASAVRPGSRFALARLGAANARRNPGRAGLMMGLMASASFILVAVAAFQHSGGDAAPRKDSGNGGFALMAESEIPIIGDMNRPADRDDLGLSPDARRDLDGASVYSLRLNPGQDASCLNLYRPTQPRILGAPPEFIQRGGFKFASARTTTDAEKANPWLALDRSEADDNSIPAIADQNTVMWILHSGLGGQFVIENEKGVPTPLRFVGLLKGSALQSEIVISEAAFKRLFPNRSGRAMFFFEMKPEAATDARASAPARAPAATGAPTATEAATALGAALEKSLAEYGFDAFPTQRRIDAFMAVERTYISAFQALGGLGLLLGTLGLAAAALRNAAERRGELALMRAVGFTMRSMAAMTLAETLFTLALGLGIGAGSAALAIAPQLASSPGEIPWLVLGGTLFGSLGLGLISGLIAVGALGRSPIVDALRER